MINSTITHYRITSKLGQGGMGEVYRLKWAIALLLPDAIVIHSPANAEPGAHWPQFRGPNGSGMAPAPADPPVRLGPQENLARKVPIPSGVSSPCTWGDRLFLTEFDKKKKELWVLCLNSESGALIWSQTVPADKVEHVHGISSPAYSTPATDGQRVYAYFGSRG